MSGSQGFGAGTVFVDVGAHEGQTLEEVTRPEYSFARIWAFEPMPAQYARLRERFGHLPNVNLFQMGLLDLTRQHRMYGSNDRLEASIYPDMPGVDLTVTSCRFIAAHAVVAGAAAANPAGSVVVKLNCEGSEVLILDDLIDSGLIWRVDRMMIDFDIRHRPNGEQEAARVLGRLASIGYDRYALEPDVMVGTTHQERIRHWLAGILPL